MILICSFIELGAGTGKMLKIFLEVLNNFDLLNNMIFCIVDASRSLRDTQMKVVNDTCMKHDIILGYIESDGLESLQCEDNNLTFVWFPSVEVLLNNLPLIDPNVLYLIYSIKYLLISLLMSFLMPCQHINSCFHLGNGERNSFQYLL